MESEQPVSACKQVIIMRHDLKDKRRGKDIAQGAHAAMAWLTRRLQQSARSGQLGEGLAAVYHEVKLSVAESIWVEGNFRKIVCHAPDELALRELQVKAQEAGLEAHLIEDEGRTEFHGVKTVTALAIGPDWDEKIDAVCKGLPLY